LLQFIRIFTVVHLLTVLSNASTDIKDTNNENEKNFIPVVYQNKVFLSEILLLKNYLLNWPKHKAII